MTCTLVYTDAMAAYDLGPEHPLKPERFMLAVDLMRDCGLLAETGGPVAHLDDVRAATDRELALVHDPEYLAVVRLASTDPSRFAWRTLRGIGPGDTPAAPGLHEASALIAGGTTLALSRALFEEAPGYSLAVAGGLHHAHRDRAAGFCVYNDPAVAIAVALAAHPGIRLAYLDIDAHHGDGVQELFYADPRVLTISLHESGRYLYPGTGDVTEAGTGDGAGYSLNVPLPPFAGAACYDIAFDEVVAPALAAFRPDALLVQCGADSHHADPLTHLGLTLSAMGDLYARLVALAEEYCSGRLVCTGGGGYGAYSVVPRAWTLLAATLAGTQAPDALPETWRQRSLALSGDADAPRTLTEELQPPPHVEDEPLVEATRSAIRRLREASPLLS